MEISPGYADRVRSLLRSLILRGSYWVQPTADQKTSKGFPWCSCL